MAIKNTKNNKFYHHCLQNIMYTRLSILNGQVTLQCFSRNTIEDRKVEVWF